MSSKQIFEVTDEDGLRLDKFLQGNFVSRAKAEKVINAGLVRVNGEEQQKKSFKLCKGDLVEVAKEEEAPSENKLISEKIDFGVVYEDDYLAVVDKPAGLCVHPGNGQFHGTLVGGLLERFGEDLANMDTVRPGIVHRLDQDTSGLMLIAKNDKTALELVKMFSERKIDKQYLALVLGNVEPRSGRIENFIARSKKDFRKMGVYSQGKLAISEYTTLESYDFFSLVKVKILTGRTHQIRVHLAHLGHPILADEVYGNNKSAILRVPPSYGKKMGNLFKNRLQRMALHSSTLSFVHPITREKLEFTADLPEDMAYAINFFKENFESYNLLDGVSHV